jgi:hypothetical protein
MKIKRMWVPLVASLVLVVALSGVPASSQAGPVQGAEVSATVPEGPSLDTWSVAQLWDALLHAIGLGSSSSLELPTDPGVPIAVGPSPTDQLTTQDAPLDNQGEAGPQIVPDG